MTILTMMLCVFFFVFLQAWLYKKYWSRGLQLRLTFSEGEAFEGDRLSLRQELTNAKWLPLPWIIVKFQLSRYVFFLEEGSFRVSDDLYQSDLYSVAMYQKVTRSQDFVCGRRGHYRIKSADLISTDIFIASKLVKRIRCEAKLTVLPKPLNMPELDAIFRHIHGEMEVRRLINPDPFLFRGIREYSGRDDFRSINWTASAKSGELMVNIHSATAHRKCQILLGVEPPSDQLYEDVLEEAIRLAASAANFFCDAGYMVGLLSNGRDLEGKEDIGVPAGGGDAHYHTILEKLARIDIKAGQGAMSALLDGLEDQTPTYLLISPYDRQDMQESFAAMLARGLDVRWLVPALPGDKIWVQETDRITRWEVTVHAVSQTYPRSAG